MKYTLVVNLIGAPGTGKSTLMAQVFSMLKWHNIDCEMVTEYAKDLVWENRDETFKDELYIFAKQNHRLFRVNGKVDVIVTDRPLILTIPYNMKYGDASSNINNIVFEKHYHYRNLNILLERTKPYHINGRNQTETESDELASLFKKVLDDNDIVYYPLKANENAAKEIFDHITLYLNNRKSD